MHWLFSFFLRKAAAKFSISMVPLLWKFAKNGAQSVKCSHSMRICTLESSLFPLSAVVVVILHLPLTATPSSHNILFMSEDPGNTTSVSALIYTMNTRGRRIYIHLKMALYSTNILHHMKTQWRILYVQIFLLSCWIVSSMILIQSDIVFWF